MSSRRVFDKETMEAIGAAIREARGDRSQAEFAGLLGVTRSTLSNYEAGRRLPNADTVELISQISGASVAGILASKDNEEWGALFRDLGNRDRQRWALAAALAAINRSDTGPWSVDAFQNLYETGAVLISLAKHFEARLATESPPGAWDLAPAGRRLLRSVEEADAVELELFIRRLREGLAAG